MKAFADTSHLNQQSIWGRIFLCIIAASLAARLYVALNYQINWDEFYFLSIIYDYDRGTLNRALQTFHVHLFIWLIKLPVDEIEQILIGRLVMLACNIGTMWYVYCIGKSLINEESVLFGLAAYATLSFTQYTSFSFRADALVCFLLTYAAYGLYAGKRSILSALTIAFSISTAICTSVKGLFLIPTLTLLTIAHLYTSTTVKIKYFNWVLFTGISTSIFFGVMFLLHMHVINEKANDTIQKFHSFGYSITSKIFFPRSDVIKSGLITDFPFFLLLLQGIITSFICYNKNKSNKINLLLTSIAFLLPLTTLLFYRNAYPYFIPFILPYTSITIGSSWFLAQNLSRKNTILVIAVTVFSGVFTILSYTSLVVLFSYLLPATIVTILLYLSRKKLSETRSYLKIFGLFLLINTFGHIYHYGIRRINSEIVTYQKELIAFVKSAFPDPVFYIDGVGMIGSFPRVGFFMSTWGLNSYLSTKETILNNSIEKNHPKFVIANTSTQTLLDAMEKGTGKLIQEDIIALRDNYIHYWGNIYIAGKELHLAKGHSKIINIRIPGDYKLITNNPIELNGRVIQPKEVLWLNVGPVSVSSLKGEKHLLRLDTNIKDKLTSKKPTSLFSGF